MAEETAIPVAVAATTVEINVALTPTWTGKFTITDGAITASSKVLCWQAPGPYTGKGTRADEAELQPVSVIAVEPETGTAVVKWQTPPMIMRGGSIATYLSKVRGNVKFSYLVMT